LISFGFVCLAFCLSCNNNKTNTGSKDNTDKPAVAKTGTGIAGTYSTTENEMPMKFVLKDDGTGNENYHSDIRPFTWTKKDGKIYFKYDRETAEFELPIFIDKGEIHYGSLVYKKE
jgi:hypothetical protein